MGTHDDAHGIAITMALPPNTSPLVHVIAATPFLVTVLNGVVAGAIAAIVASGVLGLDRTVTIVIAAAAFAGVVGLQMWLVRMNMRRGRMAVRPLFPTPAPDGSPIDRP